MQIYRRREELTSPIPKPLAAGALATIKKKRKLAALFFLCVYANSSKLGLASTQKKRTPIGYSFSFLMVAEREGFEPPVPLSTTVFKTVVIDHSTISPNVLF